MLKNRNFVWNTIGTTFNSFLSLFLLIVVTRINGIDISGKFSFAFALTLMLQSISNYGGRIYQISDIKNEFSFNEYLGSRIKASAISIILMIILIFILNLDVTEIKITIFLMVLRIIETFSDVFYASFQRNNHLDYVGISLTIKSCIIIGLFTLVDLLTKNVQIASIACVIAAFLSFIFYDLVKIKKYEKLKISYNDKIYSKSIYIFLFSFVTYLLLNVPRFVANFTLDDNEIGYLGILMMIPTVMALICQFIIQPVLIDLTKNYHKKEIVKFREILRKSIFILIFFSIICSFLAVTLGPTVLKILYGLDFDNYKLIFLILILAGLFNGLTTIFSNILTIMRKTKCQFITYIFSLILNIAFGFIGASLYDLKGIFTGLMLAMVLQFIMFLLLYFKNEKIEFKV